jgi:hypothetical protein
MPYPHFTGRISVRDLTQEFEALKIDWKGTKVSPETIETLRSEAGTARQQIQKLLDNPVFELDTVRQGREASKRATDLIGKIQGSGLVATITPLEERRQTLDETITTLEGEIRRRDSFWARLASSVRGPKSRDVEALRESFNPISKEIRSLSDKLHALLTVSADLEVKQNAFRARIREESDFAHISSVEAKSEQQPIPSESATRRGRSSRRLSDNLVLLVQRASELKARLDREASIAEQSGPQQQPLGRIAEDDVGGRSPSPGLWEEPSSPLLGTFVNRWAGPSTGSPEELLNALTQDVSDAADRSRPWLESIENHINTGSAIPEETIAQLKIYFEIFETLHKRSKELASNLELTNQEQKATRSLESQLFEQVKDLRIASSSHEDLEIAPSNVQSHTPSASKPQQLPGTDSPLPAAQTRQRLQGQQPSPHSSIHL